LKIVSIGPANPLRGGIAKFNESFAIACKKAGHETEIVSYRYLYPSFLFPGKSQYTADPPTADLKINSWLHSINPFNWFVSARKISSLQPDLLVLHHWMPFFAPVLGFTARRVKRKTGARVVAIIHNLIPHEKQAFAKVLSSYFLRSVDSVVCLSSSVYGDVKRLSPKKHAIVQPHPVYDIFGDSLGRNEALKQLKLPENRKYLLFFGLIRKYKGLELLFRSFALIPLPDLYLIVAGEFYDKKINYDILATELGISDRIIYTDCFVPDEKVKYYFSAADMVVQPYLSATQSGVTQMAYHFGTPMLVTNTGGLAEIVLDGRTGFVCEQDPVEIAAKITAFYREDLSGSMKSNINTEKYRFSWETFISKLTSLVSGS
jgi:D-inositol-3-phosphate glycosyltransferase